MVLLRKAHGAVERALKMCIRDRIYAPEAEYWTTISDSWDNTMHFPSVAGNGLKEFEYEEILSEICNTI